MESQKETVRRLLAEAFPQGDVDFMKQVVLPTAVTHRAGFAALYRATGAAIPKQGRLLEWVEHGWSVLQAALGEQQVEIKTLVEEGDTVMARYHVSALHQGEFAGAPATHRRVEWDEVAQIRFEPSGKISDLWFMCEEMHLAEEIGYRLTLQ